MRDFLRTRMTLPAGARRYLTASAGLSAGYVAQLGLQTVYFVLLTRLLGAEVFGTFATTAAAVMLLSPFVGLGYSEVALMRVSQDRSLDGSWLINSTLVTALMGFLVSVLLALIVFFLETEKMLAWPLAFGLATSELVCVRCCNAIGRIHQARHELRTVAAINVSIATIKVILVATLFASSQASLAVFVIGSNIAMSALTLVLYLHLHRQANPSAFSFSLIRQNAWLASSFAGAVFCKTAYTDLDKIILARFSNPVIVGMYAAAYKLLSLSFMPIRAFLEVTFSRQIALAGKDARACAWFTIRILLFSIVLGIAISVILYGIAPHLVLILGTDFAESDTVLRLGILLPVLQAIHCTFGNHQTATGKQNLRLALQVAVLCVYVPLGLFLIPLYSWRGAIYTSLICEGLLAAMSVILFLYYYPRRADNSLTVPVV